MPPSPPMGLSRGGGGGGNTVKGVNEEEPFLHSVKEENTESSDTSSSPPINLVANNDGEPPNEARFQKSVRNLDGLLIMSQLLAGSLLEKVTNFYEDSSAVNATLTEEEMMEKEQTNLVPLMTGGKLKPYQIKGVKWLISLWQNGLNGILADQMGLGKKIQEAGFLAHLKGNGLHGPYMIIAPLSTLSNWVNDISRFVPSMPVVIYHGDRVARSEIRRKFMPKTVAPDFPIIVTSYETAMSDAKILEHYKWKYVVVDEGHPLKNSRCEVLKELKRLPMDNKLLLTAAPLENNVANLWSLLSFIWPDGYSPHVEFESWFDFSGGVEQHEETEDNVWRVLFVSKLHAILRPFLLRRTKGDIENMLPRKKEKQIQNDLVEKAFNNHLDEKSEGASENGDEGSPNLPSAYFGLEGNKTKRKRTNDALLCLLGEISSSFQASLKSAETVQDPKATSPEEILEAFTDIPDLARADLLRAYSILTRDHRRFKSLIALPVDMRKDWLLMEIENK